MALLYVGVSNGTVRAQGDVAATADEPATATAPADNVVYGALPGGIHVPGAEVLPKGVAEVSTLSGFGYRKGLLGANERFGRLIGDLAVAFGATDGAFLPGTHRPTCAPNQFLPAWLPRRMLRCGSPT